MEYSCVADRPFTLSFVVCIESFFFKLWIYYQKVDTTDVTFHNASPSMRSLKIGARTQSREPFAPPELTTPKPVFTAASVVGFQM